MPFTMYALIDCNNFFVSCERVFNPKLRGKPVIVLSNNDGCTIARSNEAKLLDIEMGAPFFKIRHLIQRHKIAVLSSNFAIYGNLSARIMNIIRSFAPDVEVYSVDEAFIDLSSITNQVQFCINLSQRIERYTGVPVSIGIAKTRTLAKVANHIAKKQQPSNKVFYLNDFAVLNKILVRDVWGIGRQLQKRLHAIGIYTAGELIKLSDKTIIQLFNVIMLSTVRELRGISCIEIQDHNVNKGQIMVSRSFGQRVTELSSMQEAIATYASAACIKLRKQNLVTGGIYVFLNTGLHGEVVYKNSRYVQLPSVTNDTRIIIAHAKRLLQDLFRAGYKYKKVGVILTDLKMASKMQFDIFEHQHVVQSEKLMQAVDYVNKTLGRNTIQFAAAGLHKEWQMRSESRSNNYIGDWKELPMVKIGNFTQF